MKPFFVKLSQGDGGPVWVNMTLVSHIKPNPPKGSVLYFPLTIENDPAWLGVEESPEEIGAKF